MTSATYQDLRKLEGLVGRHATSLREFETSMVKFPAGRELSDTSIQRRVLEIIVQPGAITDAQRAAISAGFAKIATSDMTVVVREYGLPR
jgi:hypothetical protein